MINKTNTVCMIFLILLQIQTREYTLFSNLQFTISSTNVVTLFPTPLLAITVYFLVSVHLVFSMVYVVVWTVDSVYNSCVPLCQDAFDKGLLIISRVKVTDSLSFIVCTNLPSVVGLSKIKSQFMKMIEIKKYFLIVLLINCIVLYI